MVTNLDGSEQIKLMAGPQCTWKLMERRGGPDYWTDISKREHKFHRFNLMIWDPTARPPGGSKATEIYNMPEGWWKSKRRFDYLPSARFAAICYAAINGQPVTYDSLSNQTSV